MIGSNSNFFQSNLTQRIDEIIKRKMPTRDMLMDSLQVGRELGMDSPDYKALQPVKSYLDSLVSKKLLTGYGSDHIMSVMSMIYYIDQPHQQSYWENKR